ncbi:MAG: hypothetical protein MK086_09005 [Flavobacteriales bacterium]|nr:hypothetical protein [Flavobacteriales bacterium]
MTKKYTPALLLMTFFVLAAFLTMIYGFTHAAPFNNQTDLLEQNSSSYTLPNIVPTVWLGNH